MSFFHNPPAMALHPFVSPTQDPPGYYDSRTFVPDRGACSGVCFCTGRCRRPQQEPELIDLKEYIDAFRRKPCIRVKAGRQVVPPP